MTVSQRPLNPPLYLNVSRVERLIGGSIAIELQHSTGHQVAIGMTDQAAAKLARDLRCELGTPEKAAVEQKTLSHQASHVRGGSFQLHSMTAKIDEKLGTLIMETKDARDISFHFPIENLGEIARLFFAAAAKLSASIEKDAKGSGELHVTSA